MSELKLDSTVERGALLGSRVQDEMVFFDQEVGKYYATGTVGVDIWEFLEKPATIAEICSHIQSMYRVDEATCKTEVTGFLSEMLLAKMVAIKV